MPSRQRQTSAGLGAHISGTRYFKPRPQTTTPVPQISLASRRLLPAQKIKPVTPRSSRYSFQSWPRLRPLWVAVMPLSEQLCQDISDVRNIESYVVGQGLASPTSIPARHDLQVPRLPPQPARLAGGSDQCNRIEGSPLRDVCPGVFLGLF